MRSKQENEIRLLQRWILGDGDHGGGKEVRSWYQCTQSDGELELVRVYQNFQRLLVLSDLQGGVNRMQARSTSVITARCTHAARTG